MLLSLLGGKLYSKKHLICIICKQAFEIMLKREMVIKNFTQNKQEQQNSPWFWAYFVPLCLN